MDKDKKLNFVDPSLIAIGTNYLNFGKLNLRRLNPFSDINNLSLDDILKFEESGIIKDCSVDTEELNYVKDLVREAISGLDENEAELIELYYMDSKTVYDIARLQDKDVHTVNSLKIQAERKLKGVLIKIMAKKVDLKCQLCNSPKAEELDEFIFTWLDKNGWYFTGILKELKLKFGFDVLTTSQLQSHLTYHMCVEKNAVLNKVQNTDSTFSLDYLDDDTQNQVINIKVTSKLKLAIDELGGQYELRTTDLIRLCLKAGLRVMKANLEFLGDNENLQINLIKDIYKLKDNKDATD